MRTSVLAALSLAVATACSSRTSPPAHEGPPASVARSRVSLVAGSVPADGVTPATISVVVRDDAGTPIRGAAVSLAYGGSASVPAPVATDAAGSATFRMTASAPTTGAVRATVSTSVSVVVSAGPNLTFHPCEGKTFVSGACVPPPAFVRFPPARQAAWAGRNPMGFATGDLDGNGLADVVVPDGPGSALDVLLTYGEGRFLHLGRHATGGSVNGAAIADVTGDAVADVVAMVHTRGLVVFPGTGDGTLGTATAYPSSHAGKLELTADLDGDGDQDVLVSVNDGFGLFRNAGGAGFDPLALFTAGVDGGTWTPSGLAVGDVNGDGVLDVACAYQHAERVVVHLGNGDGTFAAPASFATGTQPSAIALADVDGDGRADVIASNYGSTAALAGQSVSVLLGQADGTLSAHAEFPTGPNPVSLAAGDLDGDGHADVVTADSNGESVSVLFGRADGALEAPAAYQVGPIPWAVAVARVDGDAIPDLIVLDYINGTVSSVLGAGARAFAAARLPSPLDAVPFGIATGDFDGDGHADVLAAMFSQDVVLARGRGDGSFLEPVRAAVPGETSGGRVVAAGDLDGDGLADAIVMSVSSNEVSILHGQSGGGLGPVSTYPVGRGPAAAALGDLDGDGRADLVVANGAFDGGTVSVLLGQAGGTLAPAAEHPAGSYPRAIALGDLNRDGKLDVVVGSIFPWEVRVLLGDGHGGLAAPVAYPAGASVSEAGVAQAMGLVVADLDGDGVLDVAATDQGGRTVGVFDGSGDGTLAARVPFTVGTRPVSLASGDVDGDGLPDLVTADSNGTLTLARGHGDGTFAPGVSNYVGSPFGAAALADLDGDRFSDVIVPLAGRFRAFRGSAAGLEGWSPVDMGPRPSDLLTADLDQDGHLDLVSVSAETHVVSVARGAAAGGFAPRATFDVAGYPASFAIADVNGDQALDLVLSHTWPFSDTEGAVGVLLGNGDGTFDAELLTSTGADATAIAIGDLTGDGTPDAVIGGAASARLLRGLGTGRFAAPVDLATAPADASGVRCVAVALGDLNGDTRLDLVAANYRMDPPLNEVVVLLGNGDGTFQARTAYPAAALPVRLLVADLDAHGHRDVVVSSNTTEVTVLRGDGAGAFVTETLRLPSSDGPIAAVDLDGDGDLDLVTASAFGSFGAHRNDGAAGFASFSFLTPVQARDLAVGDVDGDGRPDVTLLTLPGAFPLRNLAP